MKAVQKEAVAKQVKLDEESLNRLKEAEANDKVLLHASWICSTPYNNFCFFALCSNLP